MIKNTFLAGCIFILAGLLLGCSAGQEVPQQDWVVTGMHPTYPPARFVVGVGSGATHQEADDRARGEVGKFFKAQIVAIDLQEQQYNRIERDGVTVETNEVDFKTFTRVRAKVDLEGVKVVSRRQLQGEQHSLAVLDKAKAVGRLLQQVADLDNEVAALVKKGKGQAPGSLHATARALHLSVLRKKWEAHLDLLGGRAPKAAVSDLDLALQLGKLLRTHAAVALSSQSTELAGYTKEALIANGLAVARSAAAGPTPVKVTVHLAMKEDEDAKQPLVSYEVTLAATWMGETIARTNYAERIVHKSLEQARLKALYDIRDRAVRPFCQSVQEAILGDFQR